MSLDGILYFSDTGNGLLRRINKNGRIETVAGDNSRKASFSDHMQLNREIEIIHPKHLRFYNDDVLLVADHFNHQIHAIKTGG